MININKPMMKIAVCAGVFAGVAACLLDVYIQMTVSNHDLHFLFGYMDGIIIMALIMMYMKHHPMMPQTGGK